MNTDYAKQKSSLIEATVEDTAVCLLTLTKKVEIQEYLHLYSEYLCLLLNGRIHQIELTESHNADAYFFAQDGTSTPCDLVVFGEPDRSFVKRLLIPYDKPRFVNRLTTSLLVAREPRYPIKKILLIVRAEASDEAAVAWACRLAKNHDIEVTCLPVVPSQPGMYRYGSPNKPQHDVLLAEGTHTGKYINRFLLQLDRENVAYTLNLQAGEPYTQIQQAMAEDSFDLVIIAAEPYGRIQRLLLGELVTPLLHWIDRPILIAKPTETL